MKKFCMLYFDLTIAAHANPGSSLLATILLCVKSRGLFADEFPDGVGHDSGIFVGSVHLR